MTPEALVIVFGAGPVFALGWFGRGFYDSMKKGTGMGTPTTRRRFRPFNWLFEWFSRGNRLIGLVVFCVALGVAALGYTFTADQQSEDRSTEIVDCVAHYVRETSKAQAPRTEASVAANDARRDWDAGYSEDEPTLTKDQLKNRYLRLYAEYVAVRGNNPTLPAFSLAYCEDRQP